MVRDRGGRMPQGCARAWPGLEQTAQSDDIFGDPLYPVGAERIDIALLREGLAEPGDARTKHLGEAETIVIMLRHGYRNSFFVTDDRGARREAGNHGIVCVTTWNILRLLVRGRRLTVSEFHGYANTLVAANRGQPPAWPDRAKIEAWLEPPTQ